MKVVSLLLISALLHCPLAYSSDLRGPTAYATASTVQQLQCGATAVTIKSEFEVVDEGTGHAVAQTVAFFAPDKVSRTYTFRYKSYVRTADDSMIVQANCDSVGVDKIIRLESTNFGNCNGCEWDDLFSERGRYLGSTRELFGAFNFRYKKAPESLLHRVHGKWGRPPSSNSVFISRGLN